MKWIIKHVPEQRASDFSRLLSISRVTSKILLSRGIDTLKKAKDFLMPRLDSLRDPFEFKDMLKAVDRCYRALEKDEKITIFGDYDADGVCGTTILIKLFAMLGRNVDFHIPDRSDGYGLSRSLIDELIKSGTKLLITVDCGQTNLDEIAFAREQGVDTIVLDHHEPAESLPQSFATLNPKIGYPFSGLTSGGISMKFAFGMLKRYESRLRDSEFLPLCLSLSSLAVVADAAPLLDENRIIVYYGRSALTLSKNAGIRALMKRSGLSEITPIDMSMRIIPLINAAGRVSSASEAVQLFLASDSDKATKIVESLSTANNKRKRLEDDALKRVKESIKGKSVLIAWGKELSIGVIGIVASRLAKEYQKPCLVFTLSGDIARGSCRSVDGIDMLKVLAEHKEHLTKFGGHKMACGITMPKKNLQAFAEALENTKIKSKEQELKIDAEIKPGEITDELVRELELLSPYGMQNSEPLLVIRNAKLIRKGECFVVIKESSSVMATADFEIEANDHTDVVLSIRSKKGMELKIKAIRLGN